MATIYDETHDMFRESFGAFADAEMVPRLRLASVAYSFRAASAKNADDVLDKDINPGSVTVNGIPVIDSSGNWVGSPTGLVGPTGPQGPAGADDADGAPGPAGPTGPQGLAGAEVSVGAVVVVVHLEADVEGLLDGLQDLHHLAGHVDADPVAREHGDSLAGRHGELLNA